jgi:hypothetical protein
MPEYQIEVGSIYKWIPTGTTFVCVDYDLETFSGRLLDPGTNPEYQKKAIGSIDRDLNADATEWQLMELTPKIEVDEGN